MTAVVLAIPSTCINCRPRIRILSWQPEPVLGREATYVRRVKCRKGWGNERESGECYQTRLANRALPCRAKAKGKNMNLATDVLFFALVWLYFFFLFFSPPPVAPNCVA